MNAEAKNAPYLVIVASSVRGMWDILCRCESERRAKIRATMWNREFPGLEARVQIAPQRPRKHVPHKEVRV